MAAIKTLASEKTLSESYSVTCRVSSHSTPRVKRTPVQVDFCGAGSGFRITSNVIFLRKFRIQKESFQIAILDKKSLQKAIKPFKFRYFIQMELLTFFQEDQDWGFVAMVLDRLFLWIFTVASIMGTILILCEAPALYDDTKPIDRDLSFIARKQFSPSSD